MALCNITGTVYLPSGAVARSRVVRFRRNDRVIGAEYLGVVLPDDVVAQTDSAGQIDVDLLTGSYTVFADSYSARANVPDAVTADFSDIVAASAAPAQPPVWYQQALDARDEAVLAAGDAEAAADEITGLTVETGSAGTEATFVDGVLTVPRGDAGDPPPVVVTATAPGSPVEGTFYVVTG